MQEESDNHLHDDIDYDVEDVTPGSTITTKSGQRWLSLKAIFRREKKIAIIIDGPNMLRKIGKRQIKVEDFDQIAEKLGSVRTRYILLNQHASSKLIEAMTNSGYIPIVEPADIYVRLYLKILDSVYRNKADLVLIGSRDARIVPLIMKLKEKGVETAIVGFEPGFSIALKNTADFVFELGN